ncbi:unnamed protein product, partial [Trichobilharzia regenti]
ESSDASSASSSPTSTEYILSENFTLFDLLYKTLTKYANDNETEEDDNQISEEVNTTAITTPTIINATGDTVTTEGKKKKRRNLLVPTNEDVEESSSNSNISETNVVLGERLQPRMYLPLFIDIYRIFKAIRASCKENYFPNYEYVLWMYNWVICTKIGPTPVNDVDGICPKICRPRKDITLNDSYITELINLTFKPIALTMDPFDVCSQLVNTVSGTCLTYGSGVGAEEFTTQNVHSKTWNIECNEDMKQFCKNGTDKCYYRLRLMDDIDASEPIDYNINNINDTTTTTTTTTDSNNNNTYSSNTFVNTTRLKLTSDVDISLWPHCQCTKYFTGVDCSESVQPCKEILSNALKTPQLLMHSQVVKDDIDRPIITTTVSDDNNEYQKSASGDWLCGVDFHYGSCIPIGECIFGTAFLTTILSYSSMKFQS